MTVVSDIILDAYRRSNLIALGQVPNTNQQVEALRYLNRFVKSVFGNEVGEQLVALPIGRNTIQRPQGYPWYDTMPSANFFFPANTRAVLNLEANTHVDLYLSPNPQTGSRWAFNFMEVGAGQSATVYANGRFIDGQTSIALDGTTIEGEYLYRDDTANWVKYAPLALVDEFPFPLEFDDFFITGLAMLINPAYGVQLDPQSQSTYKRSQGQIRARYHTSIPTRAELGLLRMSRTATDRDRWDGIVWGWEDSESMFNSGYPS